MTLLCAQQTEQNQNSKNFIHNSLTLLYGILLQHLYGGRLRQDIKNSQNILRKKKRWMTILQNYKKNTENKNINKIYYYKKKIII